MSRIGLLALALAGALFVGGCGGKEIDINNYPIVGVKTLPLWLMVRQYYGIERDYAMSGEDAAAAVVQAVESTGGYVRYITSVGDSRTIYARNCDEKHVVIDIDPYRGYCNRVEIDINVGLYGDKVEIEKIFAAIPGEALTKEAKAALDLEDTSRGCAVEPVVEVSADACPAGECDR